MSIDMLPAELADAPVEPSMPDMQAESDIAAAAARSRLLVIMLSLDLV
jgi:hypothetical protein